MSRPATYILPESSTSTGIFVEVPATSLAKVQNRAELHLHFAPVVVTPVHDIKRVGGLFLLRKFAVGMAQHVVSEIVADVQGLDSAKL